MRLTAMMNLPVTYIFSHDGIGSAQDGPSHQAGEHIAALRLVPNMGVFRPSDDMEAAAVYEYVFEKQKPAAIILSRGNLPCPSLPPQNIQNPDAILIASGSEVQLCVKAQTLLVAQNINVRVISIPCMEMFDISNLSKSIPVVAVELGSGMPWWAMFGKHGLHGDVISFDTFGPCGKDTEVLTHLGFTPEKIADRVLELI